MTHVKRLVMQGFKSFPKKTEMLFTQGINVILGPNGSGKSNVSDAMCFVLGRLSIKSMRAAKAGNLIFLGSKAASPSKEAAVEIVFDNSQKTFSIDEDEISIKRIVRRNGQSIYKINGQVKTRQEVLALLAQGGIDPQGFNIILQGEIQNFVRMQPEERRKVIEEVSGISIYEMRKEKSLKELEKTEDRLKEVGSILRERTAYLNNLEKERQQALRYKKLESDIKRLKASIINSDLSKKKKQVEQINFEIEKKHSGVTRLKNSLSKIELETLKFKSTIDEINQRIQNSTGFEQEKLNKEIANLRAELAGMSVKLENHESKISGLESRKKEVEESISETEKTLNELKNEPLTTSKKKKELEEKKKELEKLDESRKKFYALKSELSSLKEKINDRRNLLQNYEGESDALMSEIETVSIGLVDPRASSDKLEKLKSYLEEKRNSLGIILKKEAELERKTFVNESEIDNQNKIIEKIARMDICPICKNKITPKHMEEIKSEILPHVASLKKEIESADRELKTVYGQKEILGRDINETTEKIVKTESDIAKLSRINDRKNQIKLLNEKSEKLKSEIISLEKKRLNLEKSVGENSNIDEKYDNLSIEVQEISLRTKETVSSEVAFKEREMERFKISLKQIIREEKDVNDEFFGFKKILEEKQSVLSEKRKQETELTEKFKKLIVERDSFHAKVREKESEALTTQHNTRVVEQEINDLKIDKARVDAEAENLETELLEFSGVEFVPGSREILAQRLAKAQQDFSSTGTVNLRSLEVYDSIKKEYDSIKEKSETVTKEKEGILKIIHEIDIKKKKAFMQTLEQVNDLFSRNFSQLSSKGQVYLEIENKKDPFEAGVQIIVKTGHGKYFDVKSLSGGEQTLVALSLIFAIQEFRPYSFYLLDEIDAALDKRNSERLAALLSKYMQQGQYIVISHNDEVISKATNIYGVSMQEGISKIISLKV